MIDGREITDGSYAIISVNDSRDGMRAMSIEELKTIYHIRYDRWLRNNETAIVRDARYQGTYTITNEQTGHLMKLHLWTVDWLNWNGAGATERCILKGQDPLLECGSARRPKGGLQGEREVRRDH